MNARKVDELLGEAHRQVVEVGVLHELADAREPQREHGQEFESDVGPRPQQGAEIPAIQHDEIVPFDRRDGRRSRTRRQESDLSDQFTWIEHAEHQVVTLGRGRRDLELSARNNEDL